MKFNCMCVRAMLFQKLKTEIDQVKSSGQADYSVGFEYAFKMLQEVG